MRPPDPRRQRAAAALAATLAVGAGACATDDVCAGGRPAPGSICTLAGTGERVFNGDGLDALATNLSGPTAAKVGPDGRLFIVDANNQRIRTLDGDGRVETVAGNGVHDPGVLEVPAVDSPLENPVDLEFDAQGRMVIVSLHDPRILVVGEDGMLRSLAGIGEYGDSGDGGPAYAARFLEPTGIAIAGDGTVFVADGLASRVRAIAPDGTMAAVAGTGEYGYAGDGGPAVDAMLDYPTALAFDLEGRLLIADSANDRVRRVDRDGTIATIAGTGAGGFSGDGGTATDAALASPEGLAVDADGAIYVADTRNHRIRRIDPDGTIDTIAGNGTSQFAGDGGPAVDASLYSPTEISVRDGLLYVADQNNERIRVVSLSR